MIVLEHTRRARIARLFLKFDCGDQRRRVHIYPQADDMHTTLTPLAGKFYAGYLGLWNPDEASCNLFVNLRCLEVEEYKINIYVGCGITGESNPEKEFLETEHKSQIMKSIL